MCFPKWNYVSIVYAKGLSCKTINYEINEKHVRKTSYLASNTDPKSQKAEEIIKRKDTKKSEITTS